MNLNLLNNPDNKHHYSYFRMKARNTKSLLLPFVLLLVLANLTMGDPKVIFAPDYSLNERPPTEAGQPVLIELSINLRNILDVKEKEQLISLETTLRLYWKVCTSFCILIFKQSKNWPQNTMSCIATGVSLNLNNSNVSCITCPQPLS